VTAEDLAAPDVALTVDLRHGYDDALLAAIRPRDPTRFQPHSVIATHISAFAAVNTSLKMIGYDAARDRKRCHPREARQTRTARELRHSHMSGSDAGDRKERLF